MRRGCRTPLHVSRFALAGATTEAADGVPSTAPRPARRKRQLAFQTSAKLPPEIEPGWARTAELPLFVMTISFGA